MTPKVIRDNIEAYKENKKESIQILRYNAWLTGIYMRAAIGSTFGKSKYPENPLSELDDENIDDSLTPEERDNREIQKMILYEDAWIKQLKRNGLPETIIH
jgi:hypothetical protein